MCLKLLNQGIDALELLYPMLVLQSQIHKYTRLSTSPVEIPAREVIWPAFAIIPYDHFTLVSFTVPYLINFAKITLVESKITI